MDGVVSQQERMRFGVLTFGVHRPDQDAALQLAEDIVLAEHADRLGLDEFWWHEHHTGGWRIVGDPMLMAARAAASTHRITLGAALTTAGRRDPHLLLDSAVQLDHLARGRFALGIDPAEAPEATAETTAALTTLLTGATLTAHPRHAPWSLRDAELQLPPYSEDGLDLRAVALGSDEGARLAGRFGLGLLSFGAAATTGLARRNAMAETWARVAPGNERRRRDAARQGWTVVSPMHLAPTEIEARRQVRHGLLGYWEQMRAALPLDLPPMTDVDAIVDALHASGHAVVGTPAMAAEHLERLIDLSGGFGTFLLEHGGWATPADGAAGLELFAREVVPRFRAGACVRAAIAASTASTASTATPALPPTPPPVAPRQPGPVIPPTPARGITRASHRDADTAGPAAPLPPAAPPGRHALGPPDRP